MIEIFTKEQLELMLYISQGANRIHNIQGEIDAIQSRIDGRLSEIIEFKARIIQHQDKMNDEEVDMIDWKEQLLKSMWNNIATRNPDQTSIDDPVIAEVIHGDQIGREV